VAGAALEARRQYRAPRIVADGLTCAAVVAELRRRRAPVVELGPLDVAKACGALTDALEARRFAHRAQHALDQAASRAVRRRYGDAWSWSRTRSEGDIAPLMACAVAAWGAWTAPPVPPAPAVAASR
jgi:hypothetical protein